MTPRQFRTAVRAVHLACGAAAALLVYVPLIDAGTARLVLGAAVIPVLVLSGLALWHQAKLRRLFGGGPRQRPTVREG